MCQHPLNSSFKLCVSKNYWVNIQGILIRNKSYLIKFGIQVSWVFLVTIQSIGVCVTSSLVNYSGVAALTLPCNVELQDCYTFVNWTEWGWTSSDARLTSPFGWIRPCTCSVFSVHLNSPYTISSCSSNMNRLVWPSAPSRSDSNCSTQKTVSLLITADVSFLLHFKFNILK